MTTNGARASRQRRAGLGRRPKQTLRMVEESQESGKRISALARRRRCSSQSCGYLAPTDGSGRGYCVECLASAWRASLTARAPPWRATGISGSEERDGILETVETRFGACRGTLQQWLALSCRGLTALRHPTHSGAVLHAGQKSRSRRHDGSLPTHLQAGLGATQSTHPHAGLAIPSPRQFIRAQ